VRYLDLDPADAHLLALAGNRLNELSPWDETALLDILSGYGLEGAELAGWSSEDLDKMGAELADDVVGPADDESERVKTDFALLIECEDEREQLHVIGKLDAIGVKCRALT
jgi:hypothetical protein